MYSFSSNMRAKRGLVRIKALRSFWECRFFSIMRMSSVGRISSDMIAVARGNFEVLGAEDVTVEGKRIEMKGL